MQVSKDKLKQDFDKFSVEWCDSADYNSHIYSYFEAQVNAHDFLSNHDKIVGTYKLGYGEKAFRYLWLLLFAEVSDNAKFLEIGVYKGSILALSQLCSKALDKTLHTYGLTPLNSTGDKYSIYNNENYEQAISYLFHLLDLNFEHTSIIEGLSTDPSAKEAALNEGPYDIIYIDGGHDYLTVINDIEMSDKMLKSGGFLVLDDASSDLSFHNSHRGFTGHPDVALAIKDCLEQKVNYRHLFACGHNRVWKKQN